MAPSSAVFQAPEIEAIILKKVVSNLNALGIRQHLLPQDTLLRVTKKLAYKDPIYVTKPSAGSAALGNSGNFVVTCIVGMHHVAGQSCNESRATELAACSMLVRLLKADLPAGGIECSADSCKPFRYLNLGFRMDTTTTFQSIEQLQVPLDEDPPNKVTKICYLPRDSDKKDSISSKEFNSRYKMDRRIDTGSFGVVMMGTDLETNTLVALKFEAGTNRHSKLFYEQEVTRRLHDGGATVPRVLDFFSYKTHLVLVMPFLGPSLEMMYKRFKPFSAETVRKLGDQMLSCIQSVHAVGFIHRDIEPGNFVLDFDQKVWIIDLGLSKPYGKDDKAKIYSSLDPRENFADASFSRIGTRRYATIRSHMGVNQNFQDDLIALGYTLAYFLNGRLPWSQQSEAGVEHTKKEMEQRDYVDLYQDMPDSAHNMLRTYFKTVLKNEQKKFKINNYLTLHDVLKPLSNNQQTLFEWETA